MKRFNRGIFLLAVILQIFSATVYAAQPKFSIVPMAGSVTSMLLPSNFTETIQYQVTNQTNVTRSLTMVPITGVSQNVVGAGLCSNPFTLGPQQSCILELIINGSQIPAEGIHSGPQICKIKGAGNISPDPYLCSQPSPTNTLAISTTSSGQFAYIANQFGNSISFCQVNPATGRLTNCAITATGLGAPEGVGLNPAGTFFYAANPLSSSISVCRLNQTTGALSNCVDSGGTGFSLPDAITFSPDGRILYTSNFGGQSVSACLVNSITGMLSSCVNNPSATFSAPGDMVVNAAGTIAYVVNRTANTTSVCRVSGQTVNACDDSSGGQFNGPEGITLSLDGLHAYIANAGDRSVVVCDIRQGGTGLLDNCVKTGGEFAGTGNIGLNSTGSLAYVPNQTINQIFVCNVSHVTGELSGCLPSQGTGFSGPAGVVLH